MQRNSLCHPTSKYELVCLNYMAELKYVTLKTQNPWIISLPVDEAQWHLSQLSLSKS